ncbi:DUF4381 domain-containing protein [Porticoccus sp. GXU_MW_L64]
MNTDPLAQLKDIHLPEATGWWPLAPGLWALLIAVVLLIAFGLWLCWRYWQRNRYRRLARRALAQQFAEYHSHQNQSTLCQQLVTTLRRCLLSSGSPKLTLASSQPTTQLLQARNHKGQHCFNPELVAQIEQQLYAAAPVDMNSTSVQEVQRNALQWVSSINVLQFGEVHSDG